MLLDPTVERFGGEKIGPFVHRHAGTRLAGSPNRWAGIWRSMQTHRRFDADGHTRLDVLTQMWKRGVVVVPHDQVKNPRFVANPRLGWFSPW